MRTLRKSLGKTLAQGVAATAAIAVMEELAEMVEELSKPVGC